MVQHDPVASPKKKRARKPTPVPGQTGSGSGPAPAKPIPHAKVLTAIRKGAKRKHATPMETKAAVETGLVETKLRNLPGGDRDSAGWRQERKSLYPNPTNLHDSIDRFFDETRAKRGKYTKAGDLAAAVQRPDARYRDRYGKRSKDANRLIRLSNGIS